MEEIRFCKMEEIDKLQKFIHDSWRENHILSRNKELLAWQYLDEKARRINFAVAVDTDSEEFIAILGFIPLWHFDEALKSNNDIWLSIWKTIDSKSATPGVGLLLYEYIINQLAPNSIASIGINNAVKRIYKLLKFRTDQLNQFYFLNRNLTTFNLVEANINTAYQPLIPSKHQVIQIEELETVALKTWGRKSIAYLVNRYKLHPVYTYSFYGVFAINNLICILIVRKIYVNNSACLRIVDIYGETNQVGSLASELNKILNDQNSEYIDCLNYGVEEHTFEQMGFIKRVDEAVIPNYFEPFTKTNVDIQFAYKCSNGENRYLIFKGDSDQDRPN